VETDNKKYGIRCHVDSPRAKGYFNIKRAQDSKIDLSQYVQIDFPYSLDEASPNFGAKLSNGFVLCSDQQMRTLDSVIKGDIEPIKVFTTNAHLISYDQ
jgi:hypothetical protein